jgi:hypothetical protein
MSQQPARERVCPRCKETYYHFPALSRRDNKTDICSTCGVAEAIEDFRKEKYEGPKYWKDEPNENK